VRHWLNYCSVVLLYPRWILSAEVPHTGWCLRFFLSREILRLFIIICSVWNTLSHEFFAWQEIGILLLRRDTCLVNILFDNIFSPIPLSTSYFHYRIINLSLLHYDLFGLDLLLHDLHLNLAFLHEILNLQHLILQVLLFIQLQLEVFMLLQSLL
jgi:hypothetical protein